MGDFTEFSSKKKLLSANVLSAEQFSFINDIKYVFAAALHNSNRYMVLTLYRDKAEPRYSFLIADLKNRTTEHASDCKTAKQIVRERFGIKESTANTKSIPHPCCDEVDRYLEKWNSAPDYYEPDRVLTELFTQTYPNNTSVDDIIIKTAALNTIYNTHIYSVYKVAEHIRSLDIDRRIITGDDTLVNEIMSVSYGDGRKIDHYSFATKYCSFHNPDAFPIYDSYVGKILQYYRDNEGFSLFRNIDLKDYPTFKRVISEFRHHFGLEKYTTKELDQYLWQFGKDYF